MGSLHSSDKSRRIHHTTPHQSKIMLDKVEENVQKAEAPLIALLEEENLEKKPTHLRVARWVHTSLIGGLFGHGFLSFIVLAISGVLDNKDYDSDWLMWFVILLFLQGIVGILVATLQDCCCGCWQPSNKPFYIMMFVLSGLYLFWIPLFCGFKPNTPARHVYMGSRGRQLKPAEKH